MHGREQHDGQADDEGGTGQGVSGGGHGRVTGGAGHHEGGDGHEQELPDQPAEGAEVGVVEQAVDVGGRLVPRQPRQQPDQHTLGQDEAQLAPEGQAEPEARALVAEELPEEEVGAQAADRVDDPDDPHAEQDGGDVLEDGHGRTGAMGPGHHQPGGPEREVGHEGVRERDHERHVAQEHLVAPEAVVERVAGVRDAGVDGTVLGDASHGDGHRGVDGGAPPAQVADGQHHEGDAEERHVPAADERAQDLRTHGTPPLLRMPTLPEVTRASGPAAPVGCRGRSDSRTITPCMPATAATDECRRPA